MRLIQNLVTKLRALTHASERGSILILAALSALIIFGSAGLSVDVARLYAARAELSRDVDAAALAGVLRGLIVVLVLGAGAWLVRSLLRRRADREGRQAKRSNAGN
jgi:hypothetical protein